MKINVSTSKPVSPPTVVHLELSGQEVMVLRTIMRSISGRTTGPRSVAKAIEEALRDAGINYYVPELSYILGILDFPGHWDTLVASTDED